MKREISLSTGGSALAHEAWMSEQIMKSAPVGWSVLLLIVWDLVMESNDVAEPYVDQSVQLTVTEQRAGFDYEAAQRNMTHDDEEDGSIRDYNTLFYKSNMR